MQALNLPAFDHKVQCLGKQCNIFDLVRKKYVRLTPEEWVRQHLVHYLVHHLGYPPTLFSLERNMRCKDQRQQRPDIVLYGRSAEPFMLIECKAPTIPLSTDTLGQIARYNAHFKVRLLVLSNGIEHLCWEVDYTTANHNLLPCIPYFNSL